MSLNFIRAVSSQLSRSKSVSCHLIPRNIDRLAGMGWGWAALVTEWISLEAFTNKLRYTLCCMCCAALVKLLLVFLPAS